jgi:hypothetical protein
MPWKPVLERFGVCRFRVSGIDFAGPCHYFVEQVSAGSRRLRGTIDLRGHDALETLRRALEPTKTVEAVLLLGDVQLKAWGTYLDDAELLDVGSFDRGGLERLVAAA